jgi:hypothetical protein
LAAENKQKKIKKLHFIGPFTRAIFAAILGAIFSFDE